MWSIPRGGLYGFTIIAFLKAYEEGTGGLWCPVFLNLLLFSGLAWVLHWLSEDETSEPTNTSQGDDEH